MPPYDTFSCWLERICQLREANDPQAGQTILPTIGGIKERGWTVLDVRPKDIFVEIAEWDHTRQRGLIYTNNSGNVQEPTPRTVSGKCLRAVYFRFAQLAQRNDLSEGKPLATANDAYNRGTRSKWNWQENKLAGIGPVPVSRPGGREVPFLAPIVFRFCGGSLHNAEARAFAIAHGLHHYLPNVEN